VQPETPAPNLHGSDFMLQALTVDPDITQKRMGDGFYEQRLINEQVARLTGYARLANYSSDEQQYQALMNAGITLAQPLQLRVGIALTAEQVAQLTSDIVWLVQQEVTLTDGSKQKVLVPQVYAVARSGDLAANGALLGGVMSGNIVNLNTTGDITNSHASIQGRELVILNGDNVRNLAGRIEGKEVSLNATQDIENIGGAVIARDALQLQAGRDIKVQTTTLESRSATGGTGTPAQTAGSMLGGASGGSSSGLQTRSTDISRVAGLYVTGDAGVLLASAGRDIALTAALLQSKGSLTVSAARDLTLNTVTTSASMDATMNGDNYNRTSRSTEAGTVLQSSGNTTLSAGQDITARAANVQAAGDLNVSAGNDVVIESGIATSSVASARKTNNSGFLSSSTRTERSSTSSTQAIASNFGGNNVRVTSGQDIGIKASNVVADKDVTLAAGGNVTIEAGTNTQTQTSYSAMSESGLMTSGGLDISIGTRDQSTDQKNTRTTAAASTVGSTGGNVNITAGQTYAQTGSDVVAPAGDVSIAAQKVDITSAAQNSLSQTDTEFKQSGLTLSISNPVLAAAQTINNMGKAIEKAKDGRMQALALASAGAAGYNAADAVQKGQGNTVDGKANQLPVVDDNGKVTGYRDATTADKMGGISINLSLGSSSSESHSTSQATTQRGSSVVAGGNVNIKASGGANDSDITVAGSSIQAGNTVTLDAQNNLNLVSTQSTTLDTSSNSSSSGSIGVGYSTSAGFNVNASASESSGRGNGSSVTQNNTLIQGQQVALKSGSDTTLAGAVVSADKVTANVGGNLLVESRQDTDTYQNRSSNSGGSISVGTQGGSGSISAGKSNTDSNYASVTQQSGIRSGDGGFDITVQGKTQLVGGVISTTDTGVKNGNNKISSAGGITTQDIQNSASYSAESSQVTVGTSAGSSGAGFGNDSGSAASTTQAGISGIAGNTAARTGDAETGINKIFNQQAVAENVNAQVQITQTAGQQVPKATASAMDKQANDLITQARAEPDSTKRKALLDEAAKYQEGGSYRIAAHTLFGALSGGVGGAAAAGTVAANAQNLNDLQDQLAKSLTNAGVEEKTAKAIANVSFNVGTLVAGNAVGGGAGATAALNVDANNRQLHPDERKWAKDNAGKYKAYLKDKRGEDTSTEEAYQRLLSAGYAVVDDAAQRTGKSDEVAKQFIGETSPKTLFVATAEERKDPLLGGNPDGSYTPEQQARFGVKTPSELVQVRLQAAQTVAKTTCATVACAGDKVQKIVEAVTALEQQRTLYQDDPVKAANISAQQNQLLGSLSKQDILGAKLQAADEALLFEVLTLPTLPSLSASLSRSNVLSKLTTRVEVSGSQGLGAQAAKGANGEVVVNESLASLNSPATRHYADKVTQKTVPKDLNTVIDRSVVDISADVSAIRSGQSQKIGDTFVVNGRTYGMHDGTLYPMSGPGLYTLDRGGYKALGVLNKFGDTPQAQVILNNMGVSAETKAAALDVFKVIKK
jgi:filamentous hemagglutinin